jgi:phenylalanine ammonia-lyase
MIFTWLTRSILFTHTLVDWCKESRLLQLGSATGPPGTALAECAIKPIKLGAKEGLAIVNGTAISAGVSALGLHDALLQAALSQVLTAMSVEALCDSNESFDPFFAKVRPHPGQVESAHNVYAFLTG